MFMETSAKTNYNITELFEQIAYKLPKKQQPQKPPGIIMDPVELQPERKSCCWPLSLRKMRQLRWIRTRSQGSGMAEAENSEFIRFNVIHKIGVCKSKVKACERTLRDRQRHSA